MGIQMASEPETESIKSDLILLTRTRCLKNEFLAQNKVLFQRT